LPDRFYFKTHFKTKNEQLETTQWTLNLLYFTETKKVKITGGKKNYAFLTGQVTIRNNNMVKNKKKNYKNEDIKNRRHIFLGVK